MARRNLVHLLPGRIWHHQVDWGEDGREQGARVGQGRVEVRMVQGLALGSVKVTLTLVPLAHLAQYVRSRFALPFVLQMNQAPCLLEMSNGTFDNIMGLNKFRSTLDLDHNPRNQEGYRSPPS